MEKKDTSLTKETFNAILKAVKNNGWSCISNGEKLTIQYGVRGENAQHEFYILLDDAKQLVVLMCKMPFAFVADKRADGALATCAINYEIADGNFAYDFTNGLCHFKMTATYRDSVISPSAFEYMLNYSVWAVEKYYTRLYRIAIGLESAK